MRNMLLPPVGFGPGSQPDADDGAELAYVPMPSGMQVYEPRLPRRVDPATLPLALPILASIRDAALAHAGNGGANAIIMLDDANPAVRALIDETLGEGEVSILVADTPRIEIQESVFAGVWRMTRRDDAGRSLADRVEIGAIPAVVKARSFAGARIVPPSAEALAQPGVVNAPAILTELADKAAGYRPGATAHVVNLTLLPHTPEDLVLIEATLGAGPTTILSRGYGNCRITATGWPNVWWVRFYNSMDTLILDTIEVIDIPVVALAAAEDIADSAERIGEVMEALA
ncbi:MAG: hydrogenase expression/formation protein [Hyphomicrobiaceae bacterium]|nr:hydrogenase expression/formation protein [Hyphomicrobiaceae bacterium]